MTLPKITVNKVADNIYQLDFATQRAVASTFLRFQEYYESSEFKGRVFTLDEYKKWYAGRYGSFSYYNDWNGFNIPGEILEPFQKGLFDPLSKREQVLLESIENIRNHNDSFYLLGTHKKANYVISHEIAHGLWYLNTKYRNLMKAHIKELPFLTLCQIAVFLKSKSYHPDVIEDETHAYLLTDVKKLTAIGVDISCHANVIETMQKTYNKFSIIPL